MSGKACAGQRWRVLACETGELGRYVQGSHEGDKRRSPSGGGRSCWPSPGRWRGRSGRAEIGEEGRSAQPRQPPLPRRADRRLGIGGQEQALGHQPADATLFQRADNIEAGWAAVDPLLKGWPQAEVTFYPAGSAGPAEADALLARDGRRWLPLATV